MDIRIDCLEGEEAGGSARSFVGQAASLFQALASDGAALGWVSPPETTEVAGLLNRVIHEHAHGDAHLLAAWAGDDLVGVGYWRRYSRPTHRCHADVEKIAIAAAHQGKGIGRRLMDELVLAATDAGIEVLTLDFRGDNHRAAALYRSVGFIEYGRLRDFVAVGNDRYDAVLYAMDLRRPASASSSGRGRPSARAPRDYGGGTDDVRLRAFTADDLSVLDRLDADPEAMGRFEWTGFRDPRARRKRWQEDGLMGNQSSALAVVVPDGTVAGIVSWGRVDRGPGNCWEIGAALVPEHRGRGVGTTAQGLLVDYLFDFTPAHRLEAITDVDNVAEQRVLERLGFRREGCLRGAVWQAGHWRDLLIYSCLRADRVARMHG